jgi:hypothetical protein
MRSTCALHTTRAMSSNIEIYHSMVSFDTPQRSLSPGTARVGIVLEGLSLVNLSFFIFSLLSLKLYVGLLCFLYFYFNSFAFNF